MGFSLGEIVLLILVGIIVVGPKRLPGMMRTAGQWVARLRRMSSDLRSQSGIDDLLRQEGLDQHLHELRSLSRMNVVDTLMTPRHPRRRWPAGPTHRPLCPHRAQPPGSARVQEPLRVREYPLVGCDAGGALPDDAIVYPPVVPVVDDGGSARPSPCERAELSPQTPAAAGPDVPAVDAPAAEAQS